MKRWQIVALLGLFASGILLFTSQKARQIVSETASSFWDSLRGLIAKAEGFSDTVYQDAVGKWTIGYGHLVVPGDPYFPYGTQKTITLDDAETLLKKDTAIATNAVDTYVTVPLTDNQRAALISFVFNVGAGAFESSTLLKLLNRGDYAGAANQLDVWIYGTLPSGEKIKLPGLITRRADEKATFLA